MDEQTQFASRWYDPYPNIRALFTLSGDLPLWIQENLGENLIHSLNRYHHLFYHTTELRSLGPEVVLNLYKSHQRQRCYDTAPHMHKALNMMIMLPKSFLNHFEKRSTDLVDYIYAHKASKPFYHASTVHSGKPYPGNQTTIEIRDRNGNLMTQSREKREEKQYRYRKVL